MTRLKRVGSSGQRNAVAQDKIAKLDWAKSGRVWLL